MRRRRQARARPLRATSQRAGQARAEGIQAYLTKPIDVQGLLQALDSILDEAPTPVSPNQ